MKLKNLFTYTCIAALIGTAGVAQADDGDYYKLGGFMVNTTGNKLSLEKFRCHHLNEDGSLLLEWVPESFEGKCSPKPFLIFAKKLKQQTSMPACDWEYKGEGYGCSFHAQFGENNNWEIIALPGTSTTKCLVQKNNSGSGSSFALTIADINNNK